MKQRFSYLDLRIITNEVRNELENCYLQNIYSLESSNRHFMLKFDAGAGKTGKTFLLVDPGMRYHLTKFQHEPTAMPTFFVQKLRKYLKNRRVTRFWTAPGSRLMVITFTEGQYYLVFEFFAGGNLILLDKDFHILTLFRTVRGVGPNSQDYQFGELYPLDMQEDAEHNLQPLPAIDDVRKWVVADKLGKALYTKVSDPSSSLLEYYLIKNGLNPKAKLKPEEVESQIDAIYKAIEQAVARTRELCLQEKPVPGYILYNESGQSTEFEPFKDYFEAVHPESRCDEFPSYNATVDNYFGAVLSDKAVNKVDQLVSLAESRLTAARNEKETRIKGLESTMQKNQQIGDTLQLNSDIVDAAINAVQLLVDQGVDWGVMKNMIELEKEKGNTVAEIIGKLELEKNQFSVLLDDMEITVQLGKSAFANAKDYFELKRIASAKIEKTSQQAAKALKSAEVKIKQDLEKNLEKHKQQSIASKLHAIRQPHWFEKFWWFLTSNQFLVVAARDESQKNLLLRRYFHGHDLVMGSDAPESTLLIIKNPDGAEIPPQSLLQAGAFCAASSAKTWEAKSKAPSWYLTRSQVPKINSMGDPVGTNDLHFIKNKVVVPPSQTDMGMALLWQIEEPEDNQNEQSQAEEGTSSQSKETSDNDSSDDEDFPDTYINSDDDFPDTQVDLDISDDEPPVAEPVSPPPEKATNKETEETAETLEENEQQHKEEEQKEQQDDDDEDDEEEEEEEESNTNTSQSINLGPVKKARGSKKKLRKYQNQDEADRIAMMERLGTLKGLQRKTAEQEQKEAARKREQEMRAQRKERARKADLAYLSESATPVSTPYPTDLLYKYSPDAKIVAAVMMFAPWASIQKAEYKVKLVFGQLKKGKASSELLRVLLNTGSKPASEREKELVAGIRPIDVQQSIAVTRVQLSTTLDSKGAKGGNAKGGNAKGGNAKGGAKGGNASKSKKK